MSTPDILHKPEQIIAAIESSAVADIGISPKTHAQSKLITNRLGQLASKHNILSVQVLGSRANGTAGLDSDIDCALLAFDNNYPDVYKISGQILREIGVSCDPTVARTCLGITAKIPSNAAAFTWWAESTAPFCLFNAGVKPDLGGNTLALLQLTATTVQMQNDRPVRDGNWREMREQYNLAYLGNPERMRAKLKDRVGSHAANLLTDNSIRLRYARFSMPPNIELAHKRLREKEEQILSAADPQALELYHGTMEEIAA